jgi:hypothetical protein
LLDIGHYFFQLQSDEDYTGDENNLVPIIQLLGKIPKKNIDVWSTSSPGFQREMRIAEYYRTKMLGIF